MQKPDVIVLGAGAAGLMCAIEAGRRGRRVLLLDHADRIGKKILISGGGRCNFTNLHASPENYLSENPHFARSALARYTPADFIAMVEAHRIPYHEKTLGQLFCDRTSRDIVVMLEREAAEAKVAIQLETRVESVIRSGSGFTVATSAAALQCESVVIATGGLSIPKMGATGFGYDIARQFGLRVVDPRPGLVPLTFSPEDRDRWCDLSGVSTEVIASTTASDRKRNRAPAFRENLLITHRGLSGPAALQISSYWSPGEPLAFNLAPNQEVFERWLTLNAPPLRTLSNTAIAQMEEGLHAWKVVPAGTEGYAKAEVTAGGVSTADLDARTMQARDVPGLFFIGEVVDVTGWLGGYNFQWAWASGFSAGQTA